VARAGRSHPNRPIVGKNRYYIDVARTLPIFETMSEWPALSVVTPSVDLRLPTFETTSEWPALALSYSQHFTLPVFETASEWPALDPTIPILPGDLITGNYQIEYGGLRFGGHGNVYQIIAGSLEGWGDLPALDSGSVTRPNRHGSWAGRKLAQERQVSVTIAVNTNEDFGGALNALRLVLAPSDDETGQALVISGRDEILLALDATVDARVQPTQGYPAGWVPVAVRWTCSDPRLFNVDRSGISIPVSGTVEVSNGGNTATHPTIRIPGPVANPVITNLTLDRTLQFTISLAEGERLEIDADAGSAIVNGDNVMSALTGSSAPVADFVFGRGVNQISYVATSGGSNPVTVLWRDAWL
jgi:hypothetical protein